MVKTIYWIQHKKDNDKYGEALTILHTEKQWKKIVSM